MFVRAPSRPLEGLRRADLHKIAGFPALRPHFSAFFTRPLPAHILQRAGYTRLPGSDGCLTHFKPSAATVSAVGFSRAKLPTDHAERCLGHVIGGVRETYDRYEFLDEKRDAFEKLAGLVALILNPQPNVLPLQRMEA